MCGRGTRVRLRRMEMARPVIYTRFDQSATNLRSADEHLPRANFRILGFKMDEWCRYHPLPQRPPSPTVHGCAIYNPLPFACYSPTAFVPAMMSPDASFPAVSTSVLAAVVDIAANLTSSSSPRNLSPTITTTTTSPLRLVAVKFPNEIPR